MPSTENATLERIQREIMDVMEREKELRNLYTKNNNNNHFDDNEQAPLVRAQSTSVLTDVVEAVKPQKGRRFSSNPSTKGVMHRFLKSRGKIAAVTALSTPKSQWVIPEFTSSRMEPGKRVRNGFVPVEERMRKEIQEEHRREIELRSIRRKSQPDFQAILDLDMELDQPKMGRLRATKSMAQLYDSSENLVETTSAPSSLKPAKSLAELCEADADDIQTPQSLIVQFEQMISKNKQHA